MDALVVAGTAGSTIIVGFIIFWLVLLTRRINQATDEIRTVSKVRWEDVKNLAAAEEEERVKIVTAMAKDVKGLAAEIAKAKEAAVDHAALVVKNAIDEIRVELNNNISNKFLINAARLDSCESRIETLNGAIGSAEVKISALKAAAVENKEQIESYRRKAGYLEDFEVLAEALEIDEEVAGKLCAKGFNNAEAISAVESVEFALTSELPLKVAVEIHAKSKKLLAEEPGDHVDVKVIKVEPAEVEKPEPKIIIATR